MEYVILVDEQDQEMGVAEKLEAHVKGQLHRAVSVFLFNGQDQLLIQQRAFSKYHSGGLWSNTCCGHPRPGESILEAANRRLFEEMGIASKLEKLFDFIYKAPLDNQLTEYEFDHVFIGKFEGIIVPNPLEAASYQWIDVQLLVKDIEEHPNNYTFWFKMILQDVLKRL